MLIAQAILMLFAFYAVIGAVVGGVFVVFGVSRVDHAARGGPWHFRLIIWPGTAALWPLILAKWLEAVRAGGEVRP